MCSPKVSRPSGSKTISKVYYLRIFTGGLTSLLTRLPDFELSKETFDKITALDRNHRYNFPARLGVNIFDEVSEESLKKSVEEWKEAQRKLKAA